MTCSGAPGCLDDAEADDRRAQDVPGVEEGRADARGDLLLDVVADGPEPPKRSDGVVLRVERLVEVDVELGRLAVAVRCGLSVFGGFGRLGGRRRAGRGGRFGGRLRAACGGRGRASGAGPGSTAPISGFAWARARCSPGSSRGARGSARRSQVPSPASPGIRSSRVTRSSGGRPSSLSPARRGSAPRVLPDRRRPPGRRVHATLGARLVDRVAHLGLVDRRLEPPEVPGVLGRGLVRVPALPASLALGELLLEPPGVGQDEAGQLDRAGGRPDRPAEALAHDDRDQAAVIEMGVRQQDGVEVGRLVAQRHAVADRLVRAALEHPAVDEDPGLPGLQQELAAGHRGGRAEEGQVHGCMVPREACCDRRIAAPGRLSCRTPGGITVPRCQARPAARSAPRSAAYPSCRGRVDLESSSPTQVAARDRSIGSNSTTVAVTPGVAGDVASPPGREGRRVVRPERADRRLADPQHVEAFCGPGDREDVRHRAEAVPVGVAGRQLRCEVLPLDVPRSGQLADVRDRGLHLVVEEIRPGRVHDGNVRTSGELVVLERLVGRHEPALGRVPGREHLDDRRVDGVLGARRPRPRSRIVERGLEAQPQRRPEPGVRLHGAALAALDQVDHRTGDAGLRGEPLGRPSPPQASLPHLGPEAGRDRRQPRNHGRGSRANPRKARHCRSIQHGSPQPALIRPLTACRGWAWPTRRRCLRSGRAGTVLRRAPADGSRVVDGAAMGLAGARCSIPLRSCGSSPPLSASHAAPQPAPGPSGPPDRRPRAGPPRPADRRPAPAATGTRAARAGVAPRGSASHADRPTPASGACRPRSRTP